MPCFKIIVAYDGTNYNGWQIQPDALTVSQILQDKFFFVFKKQIKIFGASRTDSGVHALGQVAKFSTDLDIDAHTILTVWNKALPVDVTIRSIEKIDESFNPRKDAKEKIYCYYLSQTKPLPFLGRYVHFPKYNFDIEKLKQALELFAGTHDFKNFCKLAENVEQPTIKTINSIEVHHFKKFNIYQMKIRGKSFLHNMIRRIVGAALDVASGRKEISEIQDSLALKTNQTFNNASANGLMLHKILY